MASQSHNIPLEIYHGVPEGWGKSEIIAAHALLGGEFSIDAPEATEPGAPSWMPDRFRWLQYRATLYKLADGVRVGDAACAELAIRYIELDYIGSYSGFIKERLARALKSTKLSFQQRRRLKARFQSLIDNDQCRQEFGEYKKLLKHINS